MKNILFCIPLILLSMSSENIRTNIAIIDFNYSGVSNANVEMLIDRLRDELFKINKFTIVERGKMHEILDEQGFQLSGCTSDECIVEVGKLLGVQKIVTGRVGKIGDVYSISSRIVDVETGKIETVVNYDYKGELSFLLTDVMKIVAIKLCNESAPKNDGKRINNSEIDASTTMVDNNKNIDLCFKYGNYTNLEWRRLYLHDIKINTWHVFVSTMKRGTLRKNAEEIAIEYRQKYPNLDFDVILTINNKLGKNRRYAIVLAKGIDDYRTAKEISEFAKKCGIASDAFCYKQTF